jgi:hypothetical protein
MQVSLSALLFITVARQYGLLGVLSCTAVLAFVVTAGYYWTKDRLGRNSAVGVSPNGDSNRGPSQLQVFGLFFLIAILVFALLLATHFVAGT